MPTAHRVAFGLHFGAESAHAIALAVPAKSFAYGHLPGWLDQWRLLAALPRIIGGWGHAQHLAELAYRCLADPLSDVATGAHGVGGPKMTKAFLECRVPALAIYWPHAGMHLRVAGHFYAADLSYELSLLPAVEQLGADA
jgi:hypothetical protein